jgi:hypothetical protein
MRHATCDMRHATCQCHMAHGTWHMAHGLCAHKHTRIRTCARKCTCISIRTRARTWHTRTCHTARGPVGIMHTGPAAAYTSHVTHRTWHIHVHTRTHTHTHARTWQIWCTRARARAHAHSSWRMTNGNMPHTHGTCAHAHGMMHTARGSCQWRHVACVCAWHIARGKFTRTCAHDAYYATRHATSTCMCAHATLHTHAHVCDMAHRTWHIHAYIRTHTRTRPW